MSPGELFVEAKGKDVVADTLDGVPPSTAVPDQLGQWTQVNTDVGRLVVFFQDTRPMPGPKRYHYEDALTVNHTPEAEAGAYGNHGEWFDGPTPDLQDRMCDSMDPDNPLLRFKQLDWSYFVAPDSGNSNADEAVGFADWMARPLRDIVQAQTKAGSGPPPPPPPPTCELSLSASTNPENGRYLDVEPEDPGCGLPSIPFVLYRAIGQGAFRFVAEVDPGDVYRDWHVAAGQTYRYMARAQNEEGGEGPSSPILTFTADDNELPTAPANLQASTGEDWVQVSWDHATDWDLHGYNLYLSTTPGGPYAKANASLIEVPTGSFTATGLQGGTPYYAVVRSVDWQNNESADSEEISATPGP